MADSFVNAVGVQTIKSWIEGKFATTEYVDENGGKIDKINVNGVDQQIIDKVAYLFTPIVEGSGSVFNVISAGSQRSSRISFQPVGDNRMRITMTYPDTDPTQTKTVTVTVPYFAYVNNTFRTEQQVQDAIDAALAGITGFDFQIVDTLPATGEKGIIYLVPKAGTGSDVHDEYIWVTPETGDPHYELLGTTSVDFSAYWAKDELQAMTVAEINAILNATT